MDKQEKQAAIRIIAKAFKRPDYMGDREYRDVTYLPHHPFHPEEDRGTSFEFVGFSSDSIYPLIWHILTRGGPVTKLVFWLCKQ